MSKDLLLFVAVIPAEEIREEVTAFKQYALEHFDSGRALRSPAHITLIRPFRWTPDGLPALRRSLEQFSRRCAPFYLTLNGFDCFRPRVIFVDIEPSEELTRLQSALEQYLSSELSLKKERNHGFHPHMTVAFKDLRRSVFPAAWEYFSQQEYLRVFEVNRYFLLRHSGRRWEVYNTFTFAGK